MREFAKTKNYRIYSYNSPSGVSGKVFVLVDIYDNSGHRKLVTSTGQSSWNVLKDKKIILREMNNAIISAVNNYLVKIGSGDSLNSFYRKNKGYEYNKELLKEISEEYDISVKLRSYKILHSVDINNELYLTKKRRFIKERRYGEIIPTKPVRYEQLRKKDINENFEKQKYFEIEKVDRLQKFDKNYLKIAIRTSYEYKNRMRLENAKP